MAKSDKLTHQELLERRKRIPQKTQQTLQKMISRRYAELCGNQQSGQPQGARKAKPYMPEIWAERETGHEMQLDKIES